LEIARRIVEGLGEMGFVVEHASDGEMGLSMGRTEEFDAVVLDLGLPDIPGVEILKKWRASDRAMPVLILTARDSWTEKVDGLNAGADDYITKPFHVPEVAARLRALIRRAAGKATPTLSYGEVELSPSSGTVRLNGETVDLTASEFRLLNYFMHRQGRVIPQSELLDHLYSLDDERDTNTIEVYVARLRKKLGRDIIKTLRGLGYRMG
jgi:two-component system OmpR family response regulator